MKVISVVGFTQSGKTTTIEKIIEELKRRRYSVGSLKDIHFEAFEMDTKGTNTYRHKEAGAELVVARGLNETDILYQESLDIHKILNFFDQDYVILEGVWEGNFPKIVAAKDEPGIEAKLDERTFLISGRIADTIDTYRGIQAISALEDIESLVDAIEAAAFEKLPNFTKKCCGLCGFSCEEMAVQIIQGHKKRTDCVLEHQVAHLTINDQKIEMVPFVQKVLKNNILALVKELDGYQSNGTLKIEMRLNDEDV